jgi:curli production assembly/transport component CsgG
MGPKLLKNIFKSIIKQGVLAPVLTTGVLLAGCTTVPGEWEAISKEAVISKTTQTQAALQALPPAQAKVAVAVYQFEDKTGQFKPTEAGQTLSRAVSQGGDELLMKAMQDAGNRSWFTVIERSNLNNLLKERQIITEMRSRYLGETEINSQALPPLLFAGVLFEGGIVGFDTNTITGGAAARYLGIGGSTEYRQNVVSVHLRAVSVKTGEVLASVTTEKTIASVSVAANAFRFVTFDNLLEADAGITSNEPGLLALRQAIEKSVYSLIMEGTEYGLWSFKDESAGLALLREYKFERDGRSQQNVNFASASSSSSVKQTQLASQPYALNAVAARSQLQNASMAYKQLAKAERNVEAASRANVSESSGISSVAEKVQATTNAKIGSNHTPVALATSDQTKAYSGIDSLETNLPIPESAYFAGKSGVTQLSKPITSASPRADLQNVPLQASVSKVWHSEAMVE